MSGDLLTVDGGRGEERINEKVRKPLQGTLQEAGVHLEKVVGDLARRVRIGMSTVRREKRPVLVLLRIRFAAHRHSQLWQRQRFIEGKGGGGETCP